ncbi:MAG: hypothetical protein WD845_00055 [Pirellulales bacterium]
MDGMPSKQKGTRVQFRLRTLLWGTMWFALVLSICIRQQHAATRQREALETLRARGVFPAPRAVSPAGQPKSTAPPTAKPDFSASS